MFCGAKEVMTMKKRLADNKGIALVTALMLTLITMGIVMALFYMITQSVKLSAANKRYRNVTEATYGGAELVAFDIIGTAWKNYSSSAGATSKLVSTYGNVDLTASVSNDCFIQKLSSPTSSWTSCGAAEKSMDISSVKSDPDISFLLKGAATGQNYNVYAKIVDTTAGNTDTFSLISDSSDKDGLISASGSSYSKTGGSQVSMMHIPFSYRIEVQGQPAANQLEKSNVTVLYAY